jgi:energy-coupling factor transport system permease protein
LCISICLFVANGRVWHFAPYVVIVLLTLLSARLGDIPLSHLWRRLRLLLFLCLIGAIPTVLFPDGIGRPLYAFGPFYPTYGLIRTIIVGYMLALVGLILLTFVPLPGWRDFWWRPRMRRSIFTLPILISVLALLFLLLVHAQSASATFVVGPMVTTYDSVWILLNFYMFLLVLYTLSLILTMTTKPVALVEGLTILMTPLRWLRLPVDDFALMTLISLRFIPTLIEEAEQLVKAQVARGADFSRGTTRERVQSIAALFIPLVQGTLRRAADLATALEARGYEVQGHQTFLNEKPFRLMDYITLAVVIGVMVGALLL